MATKQKKSEAEATQRVLVVFHDRELVGRIDAWGKANRRHSRSNAIEALCAQILDAMDAAQKAG